MTVIIGAFMKMCFSGPLVISISNHQAVSSFFFDQKISIIIQVTFFSFVFSGFVPHILEMICLADASSLLMKISHHCMLQFLYAPNI